jgi:chromosome segregation ATPase
MGMTQEEVKVRIGVDSSSLKTGMDSFKSIVEQNTKSITKSLHHFAKFSFLSLTGDFQEIWHKATEVVADWWYALDEQIAKGKGLDTMRSKLRSLRSEAESAISELNKAQHDLTFGSADSESQYEMLSDALNIAKNDVESATAELKQAKANVDSYRGKTLNRTPEQAAKIAESENKMMKARASVLRIEKEIADVTNKIDAERAANLKKRVDATKELAAAETKIADARKSVADANANLAGITRSISDVSMGEAQRLASSRLGAQNLPELQLSRQQARDIYAMNWLENSAKQARINGNDKLAEDLSKQALGLRNKMGFLSDMERDPLKVAKEHLQVAQKLLAKAESDGLAVKVKVTKQ